MYNQMSHDVTIGICKNFRVIYSQSSMIYNLHTQCMNEYHGKIQGKQR